MKCLAAWDIAAEGPIDQLARNWRKLRNSGSDADNTLYDIYTGRSAGDLRKER